MLAYILFLIGLFVLAGVAPQVAKRPWVLLIFCLVLAASFYSARIFG